MPSNKHWRCSRCGLEVAPANWPYMICPRCLAAEEYSELPATPVASEGPTVACAPSKNQVPERIGPYRLLQRLGEGGMGVVYLAEQEEPIRRQVALKLIRLGMDTERVLARFEAERQALALMDHSCVAKVFEAGSTPDGRPYFAMEYVRGVPINEHCDRHRLSTRERLELFLQVCDGVQHAHQKAIIHRDLKPSNVLVSIQDDRAVPKIIDFGVAKATAQRLTERTLFTELGVLIGTPEYMSPEQAEMTGQNVDTRTDVYSLGVMLYQLLVGVLPFDPKELRKEGFAAIVRKIREEEPPKPSTRLKSLGEESAESAKLRRVDLPTLQRQLRGDLDWITIKALEKDRTRRYGSPQEFAADIGRYLGDEPVLASPPSASYRVRKFVRRHRLEVMAAGITILALLAGVVAATIGLVQARRAERIAMEESATSQQVTQFLIGTFRSTNPYSKASDDQAMGELITARDFLETGTRRLRRDLAEDSPIKATLLDVIGETYGYLGAEEQAGDLLEEAYALRLRLHGKGHLKTASTAAHLATLRAKQGRYEEAEQLARSALSVREALLGPDRLAVAESQAQLGRLFISQSRLEQAEPFVERAHALALEILGPENATVAEYMTLLAHLYTYQTRYEEAEELALRAIEVYERTLGPDHPDILYPIRRLREIYYSGLRRHPNIRLLVERELQIVEDALGSEHPEYLAAKRASAFSYAVYGSPEEAYPMYLEVLEAGEARFEPDHPFNSETLYFLAHGAIALKEYGQAEHHARRLLKIQERVGSVHYVHLRTLAESLYLQGKLDEAEIYFEQSIALGAEQYGPEYPKMAWVLQDFAKCKVLQGEYSDAEQMALQAISIAESHWGEGHRQTGMTLFALAETYLVQGRDQESKQVLDRAIAIFRRSGFDQMFIEAAEQIISLLERSGRQAETAEFVRRLDESS